MDDNELKAALARIDDDRTVDDWNLIDNAARNSIVLQRRINDLEDFLAGAAKQFTGMAGKN